MVTKPKKSVVVPLSVAKSTKQKLLKLELGLSTVSQINKTTKQQKRFKHLSRNTDTRFSERMQRTLPNLIH